MTIYKICFDYSIGNVVIENWNARVNKDKDMFCINGVWLYNSDYLDKLILEYEDLGENFILTFDENKICDYKKQLKKILIKSFKEERKVLAKYIYNMTDRK